MSFVLLTFLRSRAWEVYLASGLLGAGSDLALAALATITVSSVGAGETGAAAGINNVARTLGGAFGGQLTAALIAAGTGVAGAPLDSAYSRAFGVGLAAAVVAVVLTPALRGHSEDKRAAVEVVALQ